MANVKLLSEREKRHSFGSSNWGVIFHERVHKFGWLGNFVGVLISMVACVVQLSYKSFIDVETWGTSIHVTLHAFSWVDGYGLCPWGWIEHQSLTLGDSKSSIINCFFLYLSFVWDNTGVDGWLWLGKQANGLLSLFRMGWSTRIHDVGNKASSEKLRTTHINSFRFIVHFPRTRNQEWSWRSPPAILLAKTWGNPLKETAH